MDLAFLRPLFDRPGPWVTAYLDDTRSAESADHEVELRWRALRESLAGQGADPVTLDAVEAAVSGQPYLPGSHGLAVFAATGEVVLVQALAAPPSSDEASYGPLPHVMPLVAQRGEEISYVRVLADRTGADLVGLAAGGAPRRRTVTGSESFPLHKVQAGGWSHRRYHMAAEEAWKRNAGDAAAATAELADAVGAEVVVIGGDVRAAQQLAEQLPKRWRDRVVTTHAGSRHAGAGDTALDGATTEAITDAAERHTRDVIDRYRSQRGSDSGSTGLADVATRLQRGQIDTVLLVNDPSSTDTLWIGAGDPSLVSADPQELRRSGVAEPHRVRADAALVRAIAGTGARLVLIGPDETPLEHGIGAVLRYADAATAAS